MPFELGPHRLRAIANPGGLGAESRVADHLLDVAEPVGPVTEALAGDRAKLLAAAGTGRTTGELPQVASELKQSLRAFEHKAETHPREFAETVRLTREKAEELKALGYVQ